MYSVRRVARFFFDGTIHYPVRDTLRIVIRLWCLAPILMSPSTRCVEHGQLTPGLATSPWHILSRRTRARYQRDANSRCACEQSIGRNDNEKKARRDFIAFVFSRHLWSTRDQQSISFLFRGRTSIAGERPRAEKTTTSLPLSDETFLFLTLSSSRRVADAISISMRLYQSSIFSLRWPFVVSI